MGQCLSDDLPEFGSAYEEAAYFEQLKTERGERERNKKWGRVIEHDEWDKQRQIDLLKDSIVREVRKIMNNAKEYKLECRIVEPLSTGEAFRALHPYLTDVFPFHRFYIRLRWKMDDRLRTYESRYFYFKWGTRTVYFRVLDISWGINKTAMNNVADDGTLKS